MLRISCIMLILGKLKNHIKKITTYFTVENFI